MTEAQKCLHHIAENMRMDKSISKEGYEYFQQAIKALEQEPRWIPVSERLPKETGWYLITFKVYDGGYAVCEMSYRKPENYWTQNDIGKKILDNDEVVAWMPLPEPYKTESEDKE